MNRGSEWRKWDLHVHSPASFHHLFKLQNQEEEEYQNDIWEKYIRVLEKISDTSVIGITDYFTIDGYKQVLENRKNGRLKNFNLILPNIEFRLDKFVENRRLNYHVIFSDGIDPEMIDKEFLEALNIKTQTGEPRRLSKKNIEEIGKRLKEQQKNFQGESDYV
ncbi:MAG: DNA repair protein, partial [candidate division Zixibacteria bacterium]|nr:DNA repair protein [candidate division Zixibacteria bacterium]